MVKKILTKSPAKSLAKAKDAKAKKFKNPLDPYFKGKDAPGFLVLDGGIGSELQFFRGVKLYDNDSKMWASNAIMSAP